MVSFIMLHAQLYFYLFYIFRKWLHLTWNVFLFGGQSSSCPCSCSCSFGHFFFAVFWVKRKPKYLTWFHVILLLKFRFCNSPYQSITCLRQRHSGGVSYQHPTRHETIWFLIGQSFSNLLLWWLLSDDGICAKFERSSFVYETSCTI